jgi:hypothetical protein
MPGAVRILGNKDSCQQSLYAIGRALPDFNSSTEGEQ